MKIDTLFFKSKAKFILAIFFLTTSEFVMAQTSQDNQLKYVDILPPSPAVAKLADFNRTDVNLSTGAARFSFPLTQLSSGTFKLPVSLSYSSNGVKVDETHSRVGVDFQLEAGGVITRVVKGQGADEDYKVIPFPDTYSLSDRQFYDKYLLRVVNDPAQNDQDVPLHDSESDIFQFSFAGTSGKFVIDSLYNVIQIPKTNLNIVFDKLGTDWNFRIKDASGNTFYFGGTGYLETSKKGQTCARTYAFPVATGWFLKRIELYNGDVITLGYNQLATYRYDLGVNQTHYYQLLPQSLIGGDPVPCLCPYNNNSTCVNYIDVTTQYLSSVSSSRGEKLQFAYSTRSDNGDVLLTAVTRYFNTTAIEGYQLSYNTFQSAQFPPPSYLALSNNQNQFRNFLVGVTKFPKIGDSSSPINLYSFTYNSPSLLPARLSMAQDHWGYFNAKNNDTMIPKPGTYEEIQQFPAATADREIDTTSCKFGLLTKVTYPTGGYDSLSYQVNTYYETRTIYPIIPSTLNDMVIGSGFSTKVSKVVGAMSIGFSQTVDIDLRCTNISTTNYSDYHQNATVTITNSAGTIVVSFGATTGDQNNINGTGAPGTMGETDQKITLDPGSYTISISASGDISKAELFLTYVPGVPSIITKNWPIGGARVSSKISKSFDSKFISKTNYAYRTIQNSNSSGVMAYSPNYRKTISYKNFCRYFISTDDEVCGYRVCNYSSLFSTSLTTLFSSLGNSVSYSAVLESFDDGSSNGVIEHLFTINNDLPGQPIIANLVTPTLLSNTSVMNNGKEYQTNFYSKSGATLTPIKKVFNYYSLQQNAINVINNAIVNYRPQCRYIGTYVTDDELALFEATKYNVISPWLELDSTAVQELAPSGEILTSYTKYVYDNTTKLPNYIRSRDSFGNLDETYNYYSGMSSVPGSSQQSIYAAMATSNFISQLVYQKRLSNGKTAEAHRVLLNASAPYWPQEVKEVNTSTSVEESLFTITKYDTYGNILERQRRDGITHSFLWNYSGTYPVAEAVGAASGLADATSFEGDSFGNWTMTQANVTSGSSITGIQSYTISSTAPISWTGQNTMTNFIVSFWAKDGVGIQINGQNPQPGKTRNGWVYYEMQISSATTVTISGTSGQIDELRLYPNGAQITTFTYDPEIGMTSSCDPNNVVSYFEYDGFKRLIRVRDDQNKILKANRYHFYQPVR